MIRSKSIVTIIGLHQAREMVVILDGFLFRLGLFFSWFLLLIFSRSLLLVSALLVCALLLVLLSTFAVIVFIISSVFVVSISTIISRIRLLLFSLNFLLSLFSVCCWFIILNLFLCLITQLLWLDKLFVISHIAELFIQFHIHQLFVHIDLGSRRIMHFLLMFLVMMLTFLFLSNLNFVLGNFPSDPGNL